MKQKKVWKPPYEMRNFVKLLGTDPNAMGRMVKEIEYAGRVMGVGDDHIQRAKKNLNDWAIEGLRKADKAGITDWESSAAMQAFNIDDPFAVSEE